MLKRGKIFIVFTFLLLPICLLAQSSFEDIEQELSGLKGKEKIEKYIQLTSDLTTRSPQMAILLAQKGLAEANNLQLTKEQARLTYLLGDLYYLTGDYTAALPLLQHAASDYESLGDKEHLPLVYISMGRLYSKSQNDCKEAERFYKKAEDIYIAEKNLQELATVHNYLGNIAHFCYHNLEEALDYYQQTRNYYTEVKDTIGLSYSLDFISQIYGEQEIYDQAIILQTDALALRQYLKDSFAIAISYANLGELYYMQKNNKEAIFYLSESEEIANRQGYADLNVHVLGFLSQINLEAKNYLSAYEFLKKQKEQKDKLLNEDKNRQISEMRTKYEVEKKELALSEEQIKNKNKTLLVVILIITILILIAGISLIFQKRKSEKQQATINNLKNLENERRRIALDLHDNLGAELTLISSKIDMKMFKASNEADKNELNDIRSISANANHVLRETIWSINSQELKYQELGRKVKEFAERLLEDRNIVFETQLKDRMKILTPVQALHLYRIIQEAINNSVKYSDCSLIQLLLTENHIEIKDNGKGFDKKEIKKGYGLQNMEQRAKEMNVQLAIDSKINEGTSVKVIF